MHVHNTFKDMHHGFVQTTYIFNLYNCIYRYNDVMNCFNRYSHMGLPLV